MNSDLQKIILKTTGATKIKYLHDIQTLWSGYGKIIRYKLEGSEHQSVVIKHVKLPDAQNHPRGWNTDISHQRKIRSYQVESSWYQYWAGLCDETCQVPNCFAVETSNSEFIILLEDLDASGFSIRKEIASLQDIKLCLKWLASFHVTFLNRATSQKINEQLWSIGTYWNLATRPDELQVLEDVDLKNTAHTIDQVLNNCQYKTIVHGDAKLANFCFSKDGSRVAAVDFQYVGGGCGMKDVAYFIGSCLMEKDCEIFEEELLNYYFVELEKSFLNKQPLKMQLAKKSLRGKSLLEKSALSVNHLLDFQQLEKEWRLMYPIAWTDFHRFLKGWSPGHWKIHNYSERISREVIASFKVQES